MTTILGKTLLPFNRQHHAMLEAAKSPFVAKGAITVDVSSKRKREYWKREILFAVLACSMTYPEFAAMVNSGQIVPMATEWGAQQGFFDLTTVARQLDAFLREGITLPEFYN